MENSTKYFPWQAPAQESNTKLKVFNSFTGTKVPFQTRNGSNSITWYICGPTVYDSAHIGHASNYVRFDVIQRILTDYFGYQVRVQMNITDIDDKIIKRANERKIPFDALAREFETEFMEDMDALKVRRPHYVTRVSEFIPEIVEYIETIIANGFAYESAGSVYFDTTAFTCEGHNYGKLDPSSVGNESLIAEGEGAITGCDEAIKLQKKAPGDFALWKKSKDKEPFWESPWGQGRPGWHIECSAMASNILGANIDIHVGGVDLRFPHHSNEVAQAEAYHKNHQWVNYFLHSGHLHIDGLKMSKSLKNFITIRSLLKRYNERQIRLAFLGHKYGDGMTYSDQGMEEAISLDRSFIDFFGTLKATLRSISKDPGRSAELKPSAADETLFTGFHNCQDIVHQSLADNFDTPRALLELQSLIRVTNAYMSREGEKANPFLLGGIGSYMTKILGIFGLVSAGGDISYGEGLSGQGQSRENSVSPILEALSQFRDEIRKNIRGEKSEAAKKILALCDRIRDDVLPPLGVRLEDRGGKRSVWKLEDAATLMMEVQRKKDTDEKKRLEDENRRRMREEKQKAELKKGEVTPKDMFRQGEYIGKFSEYGDDGMPSRDMEGKDLTKSALKGLAKARVRQQKLHAKYVASLAN